MQKTFDFIEDATRTSDQEVKEIFRDSFNELAVQHPESAESYMGRHTRMVFQLTKEDVYGGASVLRKIGDAIKRL